MARAMMKELVHMNIFERSLEKNHDTSSRKSLSLSDDGQMQNFEYMIIHAASTGLIDLVKQLLDEGHVDVNVFDYDGRTPLHLAIAEGQEDTAALLLLRGADPDKKDRFGNTPRSDAHKTHLQHLFEMASSTPRKGASTLEERKLISDAL